MEVEISFDDARNILEHIRRADVIMGRGDWNLHVDEQRSIIFPPKTI